VNRIRSRNREFEAPGCGRQGGRFGANPDSTQSVLGDERVMRASGSDRVPLLARGTQRWSDQAATLRGSGFQTIERTGRRGPARARSRFPTRGDLGGPQLASTPCPSDDRHASVGDGLESGFVHSRPDYGSRGGRAIWSACSVPTESQQRFRLGSAPRGAGPRTKGGPGRVPRWDTCVSVGSGAGDRLRGDIRGAK